jgi:arylsulfatase A-like enzyme
VPNQSYPDLVHDNHPVDQPATPEEGYHFSTDITDRALRFIRDAKAVAPDKPFFLYYCPGACHAPHHVPKEWSDKYRGKFDMGYEALPGNCLPTAADARHPAGSGRAVADQPVYRPDN